MPDKKNCQTVRDASVSFPTPCFHQHTCPYFKPDNRPSVAPLKTFVDLAASLKEPHVEQRETPEKKLTSRQYKRMIADLLEDSTRVLDEPRTPGKSVVRISMYDRLNPLARMPEVKDEIADIQKETGSHKEVILERNFGERHDVPFRLLTWFLRADEAALERFASKYKHYDAETLHVFCRSEKDSPGCLQPYRDGKHIILAIDLSKKKKDIMREIKTAINLSSKNVSKDRGRELDNILDAWEIYDLHHNDGFRFVEIARRKWPEQVRRNGGDSYSLKNECMQIKRAYDRAKAIIQRVREEMSMNIENRN